MTTIILKEYEMSGKNITIYLTKSTKEICEELDEIEANNDKESYYKKVNELVNSSNSIPIMLGDGMKMQTYRIKDLLFKLDNGHYRCYDVPLEQQIKQSTVVELCSDSKTCWQSALRKIGYIQASGLRTPAYYEAYCLLWKEVN